MATGGGPSGSEDRDPAGADRGPVPVDRRTLLERRSRWLLRLYPAAYRDGRGEEIVGTLLEATSEDRRWPRLRDVRALAVGGLKARAVQNRQRTVRANLRVAVMAGLAMYLSYWLAVYVAGIFPQFTPPSVRVPGWTSAIAAVTALLVAAAILLAWTAPRIAVLAGAVAASVGVVAFAFVIGGPAAILGPRLLQVLALVGLAALAPRAGHPSRHWLWLPGVIVASMLLLVYGVGYEWLGLGILTPALPLFAMAALGVLWVVVDARLMVAVLTYLAVTALQLPVMAILTGYWGLSSLPFLGVVLAISAPAVWLLQRQSAPAVS